MIIFKAFLKFQKLNFFLIFSKNRKKGVSATGLKMIIDFIYSGDVEIGMQDIEDVLDAATHLQMRHIVNFCTDFLIEQVR